MSEYLNKISVLLSQIEAEEVESLSRASDVVADVICNDGIVHVFGCGHSHVFGCGHSHLPALDTFYRAGGLACVSPVLAFCGNGS